MKKAIIVFFSLFLLKVSTFAYLTGCGFRNGACCFNVWYYTENPWNGILEKVSCTSGALISWTYTSVGPWYCAGYH